MSCLFPKTAWQLCKGAKLVFSEPVSDLSRYEKLQVPCQKCMQCRLERSRQWAMRCVHESSLHDKNCFITLTYNDKFLPADFSLSKKSWQDFMKRFRVAVAPQKIRFFMCGEYGDLLSRPHYHACIFGYDFPDKLHYSTRDGVNLYTSQFLQSLWSEPYSKEPFGYVTVGDVTFESAAYVARYITKKITGDKAKDHYQLVDGSTGECHQLLPEFTLMSRRPGIASAWHDKFKSDLDKDFLTMRGVKMRPPRFYDKLLHKHYPEEHDDLKLKRKQSAINNPVDPARLDARRYIARNTLTKLKRGIES